MPVPTENVEVAIVNAATGRALVADPRSDAAGTLVARRPPDGGPSPQRWRLAPAPDGETHTLRDAAGGRVLDNPAPGDGKVRRWSAHGGRGQQWHVVPVAGEADLYRIESATNGDVLDLADPAAEEGEGVVLREYDDAAASQRWRFVPVAPERASDPVLRWVPVSHWNGRQSWRLVRSASLRPTPDATPSFSDVRLVLDRFGRDQAAGKWEPADTTAVAPGGTGWRVGSAARFVADLTGDGRADVVGVRPGKGVVASVGRGDGTFEGTERVLHEFTSSSDWGWDDIWSFADTTGDGRLDLVAFRADGVRVSRQAGDGTFPPMRGEPVVRAFGHGDQAGAWRAEHPRFLVDTTGDGRVDVAGFRHDGLWVSRQGEDGGFAAVDAPALPAFGERAGGWHADRHPRFLVDTTGDGRLDVVGFHDDGVWVAAQDERGAFAEPVFVLDDFGVDQGWRTAAEHPRFLVAAPGGTADVVGFGPQGVVVARGRGDGTFGRAELVLNDFGGAQGWTGRRHLRLVADLTGDGTPDVVGFGDEGVWVAHGRRGGGFEQARLVCRGFGHDDDAGGWRVDRHPRHLVDLTGDGRLDLVGFGGPGVHVARNLARRFATR
ncbi:FG-GAP-like repeat-containing protein [Actinosynnema sp. NPDC053489]|uniref:FG-GAP-like repeat-containing protein n=1 Tax=Actinosynnema sp. NPDC053489 TaxID=3363916 RepID=UPI0037CAC023